MLKRYADIIIDISHEAIDRAFEYIIPDELADEVRVGNKVIIPFGRGNNPKEGYVIAVKEKADWPDEKLKSISSVKNQSVSIEEQLIMLAAWMKETYGSTMINALKTVMPVKDKVRETKQKVDSLEYEINEERLDCLNQAQQKIVDEYTDDLANERARTYLLKGITGSGKTEVYINLCKETLKLGKQVIVLVPEIALTYQIVQRFKNYFGEEISILNSRMSKGEKYREFQKAMDGSARVMIGPRSALFAPFQNLGLIIIDEEHDMAYKCESSPKYHARETAIERARLAKASVVLGSATPSVASFKKACEGIYKLWELKERAKSSALPGVEIVDLREELKQGNRSIVSLSLYRRMKEALDKKEQIMLFINRRGFNSFVSCRECGEVVKCPRCDVSLSLHKGNLLMCHYCGHTETSPKACPKCKSKLIGGYGTGTEKVEEEVKRLFPDIKTLRMDKDSTQKKGAHASILEKFSSHKADCLIGTQMIVKGHDFPEVTVVGVLLADLSLFESDYEAQERTFELLTQAAGRAGRAGKEGHVVIQTYQPENYAIQCAATQNYDKFYDTEMVYRRMLRYPPCYEMLGILITSKDEGLLDTVSGEVADYLGRMIKKYTDTKSVQLFGPSHAIISRINDVHRRVLYIKSMQYNTLQMLQSAGQIYFDAMYKNKDIQITFDFNPMFMV